MKSKVTVKPHSNNVAVTHVLTPQQRAGSSFSDSNYGQSIGPLERGPLGPASQPNLPNGETPNMAY